MSCAKALAARRPDSLVAVESVRYLASVARRGPRQVYSTPEGFRGFIRGGGNVALYDAVSAGLRRLYRDHRVRSLLDVGVGDGRALLPALVEGLEKVDVVEPSGAMLDRTRAVLSKKGLLGSVYHGNVQDFIEDSTGTWEIGQATFSLHAISPRDRPAVLAWMRRRTERFVLAEFDLPDIGEIGSREHAGELLERYERGLGEYGSGERRQVAQEFLMPVLFGTFTGGQERVTFEQSLDSWCEDLRAAGFSELRSELLTNYWWADAYLVEGS